ncbi:MAG: aminotransferase class I/II-fold pyridoxal phosphate-dependent enzyme [Nitrososphaerota archaeon]|nr:aminotransferase class I/II-fold pyridoxal phosphate-dependent enzyme [Nitrososphaerota archaeon]
MPAKPSRDELERWRKIKPHSTPIFQTSVYDYPDLETLDDYYNGKIPGGYLYGRNGLPNSTELASLVAAYENTESGVVCSSGMGALSVAFLSKLKHGNHIVASDSLYGGTTAFIQEDLSRFGIECSFVNATDLDKVAGSVRKNTKMLLVETISNPTMQVCDVKRIAKISKDAGALFLVDNTFATPFVIRPAEYGANIVMHSGTKFLGGHSDLLLGVLCGEKKMMDPVSKFCTRAGVVAGPFDCWLASRSVQTWKLRVKQASENAFKLARFLESRNDVISKVYYPGLESHPQHKLAVKLFDNGMFGAMISFDLMGGLSRASAFVNRLSKVTLTPSLGGVHTTVSHPMKTSHRNLTEKQKKETGITDAMIRVSVGIEEYSALEEEFERALAKSG